MGDPSSTHNTNPFLGRINWVTCDPAPSATDRLQCHPCFASFPSVLWSQGPPRPVRAQVAPTRVTGLASRTQPNPTKSRRSPSSTPPICIDVGPMKCRQASLVSYHPLRAPSLVTIFSVLFIKWNPEPLPTVLPNPRDLCNSCSIIINLPHLRLLSWTFALLP